MNPARGSVHTGSDSVPAGESAPHASPPTDQLELGSRLPHDTQTPDIETASQRYAMRFSGELGQWLLDQQAALVRNLLDRIDGERLRILEVGGGHGQLTSLFLERGHDVVVQGSASACFERLASLVERHPDRLQLCVSNLWHLPFAASEFDLVIAVRLLGHVASWRELIAEMARVSKRYLIVEFARRGPQAVAPLCEAIFALKCRTESATRPFFSYREEAILHELEAHRFSRAASGAQFALPMVLHRAVGRAQVSEAVERSLRQVGIGDRLRSPVMVLAERVDCG